jgi:hypothetical protein
VLSGSLPWITVLIAWAKVVAGTNKAAITTSAATTMAALVAERSNRRTPKRFIGSPPHRAQQDPARRRSKTSDIDMRTNAL